MTEPLWLDTETFSPIAIRRGVYRYAEECEVMLLSYAIGDGDVHVWQTDIEPMPQDLEIAFRSECEVIAHNAMFDRTVLRLGQLKIDIPRERWRCTQARAQAHSLPGKLALLAHVLAVEEQKDEGKTLIQLFCKPRPKSSKLRRATRDTHPEEWARFVAYAGQDIRTMRACARKMPAWNYRGRELALWHLDQKINDRGVAVDLAFSRAAVDTIERCQAQLAEETSEATGGEVESTTKRDKLLQHLLREHGVSLPDLTKSTVERRLEDPDLPEPVKELLRIRLEASLTSGSKHVALLNGVSTDGRLRGLLRFCGASRTGRWSGQLFQPQNLPRPPKWVKKEYDAIVDAIKAGGVELLYDQPLKAVSGTVRGVIIAPPGRRKVIADLSNIEGRMLAWLAGEKWKLEAYGRSEDLYVIGYSRSFGVPVEAVEKDNADGGMMRQIGKVQELALGYQGGPGAFASMATLYGVDLPEDEVIKVVKAWRKANPRITSFWYELEDVVRHAIENPGTRVECRRLVVQRDKGWLRIRLPSGRCLCYPHPRVEAGKIFYDGINQYTRQWGKVGTYGGKLVENVTQAASRDVMAENIPLIESAGYETDLTVHDEVITEAPDNENFTGEALAALLATVPAWAEGLPLAAAGFHTYRYRKD